MAPKIKTKSNLLDEPKEEVVIYSRGVKKIQEELKKKLRSKNFTKEIEQFRLKYKITKNLKSFTEPKDYKKDFSIIMKKFNLHKGWYHWLERHITFNSFPEDLSDPEGIEFIIKRHNNKISDYYIKIYPRTTAQDLARVFNKIKEREPSFKSHIKKWRCFDRDEKIYNLYTVGKTDEEIESILFKEYPGLNLGLIRTIISRYKKRMGLN